MGCVGEICGVLDADCVMQVLQCPNAWHSQLAQVAVPKTLKESLERDEVNHTETDG